MVRIPLSRLKPSYTFPTVTVLVVVVLLVRAPTGSDPSDELLLATTTSVYDSGLLDTLIPDFEAETGVDVLVIAVGTGQALQLGERGDADVLLVHSPADERRFVEDGWGTERVEVMRNGFIIAGPASDPAGVNGLSDAVEAMDAISSSRSTFCSRGDDSGTHRREINIWDETSRGYSDVSSRSESDWYLSVGQGMGDTLRMASERGAYVLTDAGTFWSLGDQLDLVVHVQGGLSLVNTYSVVPVNGSRHLNVEEGLAVAFADWMSSPAVQASIDLYTRDGRTLFEASAGG